MFKTVLYVGLFLCFILPVMASGGDKTLRPVEWVSPLPKVVESGIDLKAVEGMIDDNGQFIFRRNPQTITCWTKGETKSFSDGIVVTAVKIVHAPIEEVRKTIKDYSLISRIQSQHTNVETVCKRDNHTLYRYNQEYKMGVITLESDFLIQQTVESDGSISTLLHDGDVDAQIQRWEFFELDGERTMLALTFWSAYSTARFAFKVLMAVMSESHLIAPVMFCSMYLEQYSDYIQKDWVTRNLSHQNSREEPVIPIYTKELSSEGRKLIDSMVVNGAVFLRTYQIIPVHGKLQRMMTLSIFDMLNVPYDQAVPIISDMKNLPDAIPIVKSINKKTHPEGTLTKVNYRIGKFPILIPLNTQQRYAKIEKNYLAFENPGEGGAYAPYLGVYEWDQINSPCTGGEDATLYIYSHGLKVGPEANFYIRTLGKLMPDSESVQLVFSAIIIVETRIKWIENYYKDMAEKKKSFYSQRQN